MASESAFLTDRAEWTRGMSDRIPLGDGAQSPSGALKRLTMSVKRVRSGTGMNALAGSRFEGN